MFLIGAICKFCKWFIKGKIEDPDKLSCIIDDNLDTDRCSKTHYKVTEDSFCINNKYEEKRND